jgi:signal transduction histidine kinase
VSHAGTRDADVSDLAGAASYARALLNILEDLTAERERSDDVRKAVLNILEDFDEQNTRVERANLDLHREILERRRSQRWLEAVRETSAAVLRGAESAEVLRLIARRSRELVAADLASVIIPCDAGDRLRVAVAEGADAAMVQGMEIPTEGSITGEVIRTRRAVVLADASAEARADMPSVAASRAGPAVVVPLSLGDASLGALALANAPGGRLFDKDDLRLLESFAEQAALGLEFSRTQRQLRHLSLVEDRERIARDLHDDVIQALFAVGLSLQATAGLADGSPVATRLQDAVNVIDRVIGDLRNYIFGLRPRVLAGQRLGDVLDHLVNEFQQATGVTIVVEFDDSLERDLAAHSVHLVQLTREALSNVQRHAAAQTCRVSLRRLGNAAVLEIDDDGRGFEVQASRGRGMGLGNIATRAGSIGGELSIVSRAGEGTTLRVLIPI